METHDQVMDAVLYVKEKRTISAMKPLQDVSINVIMAYGMNKLTNNVIMVIQLSLMDARMIVISNHILNVKMLCAYQLFVPLFAGME